MTTLHILGICGTFMGGIAQIAKQKGYHVVGSDEHVYPPMSDQLVHAGISLIEGFDQVDFAEKPDVVIVGNALSRGNPAIEKLLNENIAYTSGPQWLYEHVLRDKWVLAVAGTHGKTTTSSILAWILEYTGFTPSFLIGGVPENFGVSARIARNHENEESNFFVIEADEYDTAFFDKRSKFLHYHPKTCVINNMEFDHADIFANMAAIHTQFHHLIRTIPAIGRILYAANDENIATTLEKGCWSEKQALSSTDKQHALQGWYAEKLQADASSFRVVYQGEILAEVNWALIGDHNMQNALAAIAAAQHIGILPEQAAQALTEFKSVKRRFELVAKVNGVSIYDDFAHHPTAIATTLAGVRAKVGEQRIIAVFEPRSNTMKRGSHNQALEASLEMADQQFMYVPEVDMKIFSQLEKTSIKLFTSIDALVEKIKTIVEPEDHIVVMSNGSFQGIHKKIADALS